ncbi:hypothetical protein J6590_083746 [Homalodisca vitripennis]|nr:hypothetical protein J6590_083746 [Homalodisca vitripennis]
MGKSHNALSGAKYTFFMSCSALHCTHTWTELREQSERTNTALVTSQGQADLPTAGKQNLEIL